MDTDKTGKLIRDWLPALVLATGVLVGYVQLAESVKNNSKTLERQAEALKLMTELMVTDARHDAEIESLRRDVTVIWQTVANKENAESK